MSNTILIIDDDSRNIFALSAILKVRGYQCLTALNMQDAFSILEKDNAISIILMDMMMPEMDGYEAIPRIKAHEKWKHLPIISVTAQAMAGDKERCLEAGANGYIPKPVNIDELQIILKEFIKPV